MDVEQILNRLKKHYGFKSDSQLAKFLGISRQGLSNCKSRNTLNIKRIHQKCEGISADWLLTGKGKMFVKM